MPRKWPKWERPPADNQCLQVSAGRRGVYSALDVVGHGRMLHISLVIPPHFSNGSRGVFTKSISAPARSRGCARSMASSSPWGASASVRAHDHEVVVRARIDGCFELGDHLSCGGSPPCLPYGHTVWETAGLPANIAAAPVRSMAFTVRMTLVTWPWPVVAIGRGRVISRPRPPLAPRGPPSRLGSAARRRVWRDGRR